MKMKPEDLRRIAAGFKALEEDPKFREAHGGSVAAGHSDIRIAWDCFRLMKIDGNSITWTCDHLYSYLNDTHITTALVSEYRKMRARLGH